MKKIFLIISILSMISLMSGCGIFNHNGWTWPDDQEFMAVVKELDVPQEIGNYMLENFTYEIHDFYAPDPYELWKIKKGDCNDFSVFGISIADYHDYVTYQIEIFDNTIFKHYVAVYDEDIWYSITDCRDYYFGFDDFREIVNYVCDIRLKTWTKYIVYDYWDDEVEIGLNDKN